MNQTALIAFLIALIAIVLAGLGFEKRQTNIRRTVLIAVMTALSVTGRFLFAPIPGFKPMTAIIVITGIWLGPGAGFACGAFTALISNIYFGQGPWTPFQMVAFGLIGLVAGLLKKPLRNHTWLLLIYAGFAGIAYSMIMDVFTVLWFGEGFQWDLYGAALITALPYTACYVVSNIVFIAVLAPLFRKKMLRMLYRYGI